MRRMLKKGIWGFLLMLITVAVIAEVAQAGSLEPSAAPGPTMKTLDDVPPTWDQQITGAQRFQVIWNNTAVLDKETGLVWEQSPSDQSFTYYNAISYCFNSNVGGRKGWRLPTAAELSSLVDPTVAYPSSGPALPSGHPFNLPLYGNKWSASTSAGDSVVNDTNGAWIVPFNGNAVINESIYDTIHAAYRTYGVWCVRGGKGD
jgi:hypothetical protein